MDFCARGTERGKSDITTSPWIAVSILSSLSAWTIYRIKKCYIQYQGMNLLKDLMRKTKAMRPIVIHGSRVWGDEIITAASGCPSVWMSSVWIQYSLFVAVLVAHTASFLWDSLWLQPLACTSIVGPHSYPRYAFLIGPKRFFASVYIFSAVLWIASIWWGKSTTPKMLFIAKSWKAGIMWRPYSFKAISTDESWYYIMELALAQETSDGNCGPSPSSKMTQWIGHTPKWLGIRCSTETRGYLFFEKAGKICIPLKRRNLIAIFHHLNLYQSDSKASVVGKAGDSVYTVIILPNAVHWLYCAGRLPTV